MRTKLDYQGYEQPIVWNNAELGFEILKNRVNDASRRQHPKMTNHHQQPIVDQQWCQTGYWKEAEGLWKKRRINNEETIAEFIAARREVKTIVKQEKRNKELSIARICKHNPKSFSSYINERWIVRDNMGPLKTLDGTVITTGNDMANTMNNYFSSVFTIEQLNNVPQLLLDPW